MKHASLSSVTIVGLSTLLFLTGCASSSGPVVSPSATIGVSSTSATGASTNVTLKTMETPLGRIIVGENGRAVYYYTSDMKGSGRSACMNDCLQKWPPVLVEGEPTLDGITAKVGTITTPGGKKQVTIDGMPVYYWYMDKNPGDASGQDVGKVWYVVAPDGMMMKNKPSESPVTSSPSPTSTPTALSP